MTKVLSIGFVFVVIILGFALCLTASAGSMPTSVYQVMTDGTNFWAVGDTFTNLMFSITNMTRAACAVTNTGSLTQFTSVSNRVPGAGDLLRHDGTCWCPMSVYVEGEDRGSAHVVIGDVTADGTWRDLSVAAWTPVGIKSIDICLIVKDDAINKAAYIRPNGNTGDWNRVAAWTQVANQFFPNNGTIAVDANRVVEYKIAAGMDEFYFSITGCSF